MGGGVGFFGGGALRLVESFWGVDGRGFFGFVFWNSSSEEFRDVDEGFLEMGLVMMLLMEEFLGNIFIQCILILIKIEELLHQTDTPSTKF